jgi:hypothetical protein
VRRDGASPLFHRGAGTTSSQRPRAVLVVARPAAPDDLTHELAQAVELGITHDLVFLVRAQDRVVGDASRCVHVQ